MIRGTACSINRKYRQETKTPPSSRMSELELNRSCCDLHQFKPLTVDPTFNIGAFSVTPISYQHLLIQTKQGQKHPTPTGPVLVHERKTKETYSLFCGALKAQKPELSNLLPYGADDEEALANAFGENFERTTHLLCSSHMSKNVESQLVEWKK